MPSRRPCSTRSSRNMQFERGAAHTHTHNSIYIIYTLHFTQWICVLMDAIHLDQVGHVWAESVISPWRSRVLETTIEFNLYSKVVVCFFFASSVRLYSFRRLYTIGLRNHQREQRVNWNENHERVRSNSALLCWERTRCEVTIEYIFLADPANYVKCTYIALTHLAIGLRIIDSDYQLRNWFWGEEVHTGIG